MTTGPAVIDQKLLADALDWLIGGCVSAPTADFALQCPKEIEHGSLTPLGSFALKGVTVPQLVYGVA
jgi:hypothetical protein